jgi:hypothetical protein
LCWSWFGWEEQKQPVKHKEHGFGTW